MPLRPDSIELYVYDVYFGDCFLMIFRYPEGVKKSVMIDFGSTGKGKAKAGEKPDIEDKSNDDTTGGRLLKIAEHISEITEKKLDVVIATHRHKDHIYGFGLKDAGKIILDCSPDIVIQPWTEDPKDNRDLTKKAALLNTEKFQSNASKNFTSMLNDMHSVAEAIENEANHLADPSMFSKPIDPALHNRIVFAADDNKKIKNMNAVKNLQSIKGPHYVYFGYDKIDWATILPGVKVRILGPPLLEQYPQMASATSSSDEFWSLLAVNKYFWGVLAATNGLPTDASGSKAPIFDRHKTIKKDRPPNVRWFIRRLRNVRATQLLELVGFVDSALNNTSVISHFEVGDQKLLFPGDAQIENWQFLLNAASKDAALKKLLAETTLYKVGHHGSRNATPKSLWNGFRNRTGQPGKKTKLRTIVSTMRGKHGKSEDTEVPLAKMLDTMRVESDFTTTEEFVESFVKKITIKINY